MKSTLRIKSRITTQIELTALGRHGICMRKFRAGDATVLDFPVENLRPCSQFIWPLCCNLRKAIAWHWFRWTRSQKSCLEMLLEFGVINR